ncbi:EC1118_1K5_1585p [Saccharomyces cerevisiae EC1118]|uniref:EC1118_1K5_1585p n=1 Tax=Saccharomyces cerevisiae (strain Lalvin EC1118 / Prise de mousse) TaxID=643680 RepID=C8ZC90_YEAS8|nr:EC1118_1K5_1585p [Saccharomyces cerevisiae EC1118]
MRWYIYRYIYICICIYMFIHIYIYYCCYYYRDYYLGPPFFLPVFNLPSNPALFFGTALPTYFLSIFSCLFLFLPLLSFLILRFSSLLFCLSDIVSSTTLLRSLHSIADFLFCASFLFIALRSSFSSSLILIPSACNIAFCHFSFSFCLICSSSSFASILFFLASNNFKCDFTSFLAGPFVLPAFLNLCKSEVALAPSSNMIF